jgi:hypothetical protein
MQQPPTDEELAAIVAAVEAMQPVPVAPPERPRQRRSAWHFSGRWWMAPVPVRRARPFF